MTIDIDEGSEDKEKEEKGKEAQEEKVSRGDKEKSRPVFGNVGGNMASFFPPSTAFQATRHRLQLRCSCTCSSSISQLSDACLAVSRHVVCLALETGSSDVALNRC